MEECDLLIDIIQQRREIIGNKIKEGKVRWGTFGRKVFCLCFSNEWTFPKDFCSFFFPLFGTVVTLVGIRSMPNVRFTLCYTLVNYVYYNISDHYNYYYIYAVCYIVRIVDTATV